MNKQGLQTIINVLMNHLSGTYVQCSEIVKHLFIYIVSVSIDTVNFNLLSIIEFSNHSTNIQDV